MTVFKSEDDGKHPASHYLVVEDKESPSTWHLRVRDVNGKVDHRLMGAAWAALHEGYRGNKYAGPDREGAMHKLKALYEQEHMAEPGEVHAQGEMERMVKALDRLDQAWMYVWAGVTTNAYQDRQREILPYKLLADDIARATKAIEVGHTPAGTPMKDYFGLWVDHDESKCIGRCTFRAIVPGTRMVLEAGPILGHAAKELGPGPHPASLGFWHNPDADKVGFKFISTYERSLLKGKQPANVLTRIRIYSRADATQGALEELGA